MTGRPRTGGAPRKAASSDPGFDRPPNAPVVALPADLGKSLRLLDDEGLDRLTKAVIEEARRRRRIVAERPSLAPRGTERSGPAKGTGAKAGAPNGAAPATPGQERLILAAYEAGVKPAAIARELRVSRPTVQHVISSAKRERRRTAR